MSAPTGAVSDGGNGAGTDRDDVSAAVAAAAATATTDIKAGFLHVFRQLTDEIVEELRSSYALPSEVVQRLRHCIEYNVPHGKLNRGMAVIECFRAFRRASSVHELGERERFRALLLGWCIEWLQAFFLVADDIMDSSKTRRGQACYYLLKDVGLDAINDAIMLETQIYRMLRRHFKHDAADPELYIDLVEIFQDVTYATEVGQVLDLTSQAGGEVDLRRFSEEVLLRIYKFKTSMYSFYLPVALGMRLAGVRDDALYRKAKRILLEMGAYFQAQDDFLDCFGDPAVIGKIGTDIEENKCTWPVVEALKRVDAEQRRVLEQNYARKEPECVAAVKAVYRAVGVPAAFEAYEQSSYRRLRAMIADVADEMPTGAFEFLLQRIYKRAK